MRIDSGHITRPTSDPAALVRAMNAAQADRVATQAAIDAASHTGKTLDGAEVYAMIDSLGDVARRWPRQPDEPGSSTGGGDRRRPVGIRGIEERLAYNRECPQRHPQG